MDMTQSTTLATTIDPAAADLTHAQAQAAIASAGALIARDDAGLTAAIATANAKPAPGNAIDAWTDSLHMRVTQIEHVLGLVRPIAQLALGAAEAAFPSVVPIVDRLTALEKMVVSVIAALNDHFGGKLPLPDTASPARE